VNDAAALAREALRDYDLDVAGCEFAAQAFNTVFRVEVRDGARYALRVGAELRIHADGCEELEAAWVNSLHTAGFPVARVVPARDGSLVVDTGGRRSLLFEWIEGVRLRDDPSPDAVAAAGALTARLHADGAAPAGASTDAALRGNEVLSFRVPNRLGDLAGVGETLTAAVGRAQEVVDELWRDPPHAPHLLHGDVNLGNVLVDRGEVRLIDFQDLFWGFEVQDVAIATVSLPFPDAFRFGYESVRRWPDVDPETWAALEAARHLNILNFGLAGDRPKLDEVVARHAEPVVEWMIGA
jgi:Ser/Thr protein kinase RdoA (MazF antagonist)